MKHSGLSEWYTVSWGNSINSSLGSIDGIRNDNTILTAGDIVPRDWFNLVPANRLALVIDDMNAFDTYEIDADEESLLYTVYPAKKPEVNFAAKHRLRRSQWFRVSSTCPVGIMALRTVDGVCKVGDVAMAGDIIPSQWLSGLDMDAINRLCNSGLRSHKWELSLTSEQQKMLNDARDKPLLIRFNPPPSHLKGLYAKYPGTRSDFKKPTPKRKTKKKVKEV